MIAPPAAGNGGVLIGPVIRFRSDACEGFGGRAAGSERRAPAQYERGRRTGAATVRSRMAKGNKHSPALFEVVHGKKHFDKVARDSALRTPSWWFKGRKRMTEVGALAPASAAAAVVEDAPPFGDPDIPPSAVDPTANPSILA